MNKNYIFIDRDDTLIIDKEYLSDPAGVEFPKGSIAGLKRLRDAGYGIILITNQSGIGRGYFTEDDLAAVHRRLKELLANEGLELAAIYYCPHAPDANCDCRKPKTKMGLQAIEKYGLDPAECWVVGDHDKDIEFGRQLGMRTVKVSEETSFSDAVDIILSEGAKSQNNPNNREETY
jgi:D,D-heptose 1,7-bisphosphate phosphatase